MSAKKNRTRSAVGKSSREKGARGELDLARKLNKWTLPDGTPVKAERNARNGKSTADLAHNIPGWHIECKRVQGMKLGSKMLEDALNQAWDALLDEHDYEGGDAVVMYRQNGERWQAAVEAVDLDCCGVAGSMDHCDPIAMTLDTFMRWIGCTKEGE